MENLFAVIRQMISDSRVIHNQTGLPQWQIAQLKAKLFLVVNDQNKTVCEWWLRLYHGNYSKKDLDILQTALNKDIDITEWLTQ